jgi:hypothetical protein
MNNRIPVLPRDEVKYIASMVHRSQIAYADRMHNEMITKCVTAPTMIWRFSENHNTMALSEDSISVIIKFFRTEHSYPEIGGFGKMLHHLVYDQFHSTMSLLKINTLEKYKTVVLDTFICATAMKEHHQFAKHLIMVLLNNIDRVQQNLVFEHDSDESSIEF